MESDSIFQSSEDEWRRDVLLAKSAVENTISKCRRLYELKHVV